RHPEDRLQGGEPSGGRGPRGPPLPQRSRRGRSRTRAAPAGRSGRDRNPARVRLRQLGRRPVECRAGLGRPAAGRCRPVGAPHPGRAARPHWSGGRGDRVGHLRSAVAAWPDRHRHRLRGNLRGRGPARLAGRVRPGAAGDRGVRGRRAGGRGRARNGQGHRGARGRRPGCGPRLAARRIGRQRGRPPLAGGPVPLIRERRPDGSGRRMDWWALATVAVPGAVLLAQAARVSVGPWGDQAAIQLSVDRALRAGQLLGPYSRFGWSHPGPLYFYLLAGPYRVLGSTARGLLGASVLLTVAAAVGVVVAAGAIGGRLVARAAAAVVVAEMAALGPGILSQVWNPVATIVPTTLFLVCCAGLAAGRWWALAGVVGAGSFLVQTDVSTGLVVLVLAGAAVVCAVVAARRSFRPVVALVAL